MYYIDYNWSLLTFSRGRKLGSGRRSGCVMCDEALLLMLKAL
jgi:hypothetical protein